MDKQKALYSRYVLFLSLQSTKVCLNDMLQYNNEEDEEFYDTIKYQFTRKHCIKLLNKLQTLL